MKVENNIALGEEYVLRCVMLNHSDYVGLVFLVYNPHHKDYVVYITPHRTSIPVDKVEECYQFDSIKDANEKINDFIDHANKLYSQN